MYFRKRIVSERGIPSIEHYLYEDHEMLQRAACECMCNKVTYNVYVFQKEDSIRERYSQYRKLSLRGSRDVTMSSL